MKRPMAILLCVLAALSLPGCGTGDAGHRRTVGTEVALEDVTDFYCTWDASTDPPSYQRYRFYVEDGSYRFFHEKREGDHWPLTEADATVTGTVELSGEDWAAFFDCLKGGTVEDRREDTSSGGSGPWLYLYWKGDKGRCQAYSFPSYGAQEEFTAFCQALAERPSDG